jgi:hypothetical protein
MTCNTTALVVHMPAMTEVWVRNPQLCIKECLEVGISDIVWDRGFLVGHSIEPRLFLNLYYGTYPWRALIVDPHLGSPLVDWTHDFDNPLAVFPTWAYGDDWSLLEEMMEHDPGQDDSVVNDLSIPPSQRPVAGQEHRVVITDCPSGSTGVGRKFFRSLRELTEEYPEVKLHVHGLYSFRLMFGLGFPSVDIDPRPLAKKGKVMMPTGRELLYEAAAEQPHWVALMGFYTYDLKIPRNRCIFNIKSALWASEHFQENVKFKHKGFEHVDPDDPMHTIRQNKVIITKRRQVQEGDKFLCETCSLQTACKYFREGAVCSVPDSEPAELATFFNTRDSDTIIQGLGVLIASQTRRLERGMTAETEDDDGKLDPEVTKLANNIFNQGHKLAKLINPALTPKPNLNLKFASQTINVSNPAELMAAIIGELESRGVKRENITQEMVMSLLQPAPELPAVIEATATEARAS